MGELLDSIMQKVQKDPEFQNIIKGKAALDDLRRLIDTEKDSESLILLQSSYIKLSDQYWKDYILHFDKKQSMIVDMYEQTLQMSKDSASEDIKKLVKVYDVENKHLVNVITDLCNFAVTSPRSCIKYLKTIRAYLLKRGDDSKNLSSHVSKIISLPVRPGKNLN